MTNTPPSSANLRGAVDLSSLVRPPAPPAGAPAAPAAVPSLVVDGTDANFTGILDLSQTVPVVVELYVGAPSATLTRVVTEYGGRFVLATVDAAANPQLQQAFHATAAPTVAAVIGGRPIALYEGELPEADVRQVLEQLATLAAQNGVTGTVSPDAPGAVPAETEELPLPPHHQEAYDAIAAGDYDTAIAEYTTAIAQDPRDRLAVAGLAQPPADLIARASARRRPPTSVRPRRQHPANSPRNSLWPTSMCPAGISRTRSRASSTCSRPSTRAARMRCALGCSTTSRSLEWTTPGWWRPAVASRRCSTDPRGHPPAPGAPIRPPAASRSPSEIHAIGVDSPLNCAV